MANFLDKLQLTTAVDDHVKLDLSSQHITTANFMEFNVAWSKELVPKEHIGVHQETFARLDPLPVPTFGRANINNRAFFVPFRTIFPAWNDFITDTRHSFNVYGTPAGASKLVGETPTIKNSELVRFFENNGNATQVTGTQTADYTLNSSSTGRRFTAKGRRAYKLLLSLGYNINWNLDDTTSMSALPLLAVAKVYCDWYFPSAYTQDQIYSLVDGLFNFNSISSVNAEYGFALSYTQIQNIMDLLANGVNYDSDYFVSAWDNPTNPNEGAGTSNLTIGTLSSDNTSNVTSNKQEPSIQTAGKISQYALTALRSMTDYMKRHQLVGARALDRYLARFGVQLEAEKMNRSIYLGCANQSLQFGDVMNTAGASDGDLGKYAGKGISYGDAGFEFDADEYGIMIIISTIVPKVGYYQGVDRSVKHIQKLDYWTPEFDNLGTQAISKSELYIPTDAYSFVGTKDIQNTVFGFIPRYAEYKIGKDRLTGDFRLSSIEAGADSWHLLRTVEYTSYDNIAHDLDFVRGLDSGQYERIFYDTDAGNHDRFKIIHNFNVTSHSPMKSLFDTYDFASRGKKVTEDVNGVKMN